MAKSLDRVANHCQNNPYQRMETGEQGKDCIWAPSVGDGMEAGAQRTSESLGSPRVGGLWPPHSFQPPPVGGTEPPDFLPPWSGNSKMEVGRHQRRDLRLGWGRLGWPKRVHGGPGLESDLSLPWPWPDSLCSGVYPGALQSCLLPDRDSGPAQRRDQSSTDLLLIQFISPRF